jgi:hypothetical protein
MRLSRHTHTRHMFCVAEAGYTRLYSMCVVVFFQSKYGSLQRRLWHSIHNLAFSLYRSKGCGIASAHLARISLGTSGLGSRRG